MKSFAEFANTLREAGVFYRYGIIRTRVCMDACNICQLKCPECSVHGKDDPGVLGRGYLKFADFKNFVVKNPLIASIKLSYRGEIFLNPELPDIVRFASERKIVLKSYTNLNTASDEILEAIVKYRFKYLNVSIDGASNDTYKIYRVGGDFDKVIENIKKINYYKALYHSNYPILQWQFIIFGHNEHELLKARKMAASLNMNFSHRFNVVPDYSPIKDIEAIKRQLGVTSPAEDRKARGKGILCQSLWTEPYINWNGDLVGCCNNKRATFGNVFKSGFDRCMKSKEYNKIKQIVLGKIKATKDMPCYACSLYKRGFDGLRGKDILKPSDHDSLFIRGIFKD